MFSWAVFIDGFSLHAAVRVEAHDRKRLEQLCRYITRPALSDERIQLNAAGQVEFKLKTPWRNGTTHPVMSPLEFMQRLAALVPRPRCTSAMPVAKPSFATSAVSTLDLEPLLGLLKAFEIPMRPAPYRSMTCPA